MEEEMNERGRGEMRKRWRIEGEGGGYTMRVDKG